MERFDAVILISPYMGNSHENNIFLRSLSSEELNFVQDSDSVIEYRKSYGSYAESIKDLKDKMQKIKLILQGK
jgi:hypothetical protein